MTMAVMMRQFLRKSSINKHFLLRRYTSSKLSTDLIVASNDPTASDLACGFSIVENFVSSSEQENLYQEIQQQLKKLRYEYDHWDNAIHGFRELEKQTWSDKNQTIIERVRLHAFPSDSHHLSHVHVLDLAEGGYIKPHVDSVRFCGSTIAGISLLSSCVFKLIHTKDPSNFALCHVRPGSLYIMKDVIRYDYTHEVLANEHSYFKDNKVDKTRRISVICRSEPKSEDIV